jgi:trk system potassium uptake protein TrkH
VIDVPKPRTGRLLRTPGQLVVAAFGVAVAAGTGLLMLPAARAGEGGASVVEALFTATSAVCVTGLVVVDTPSHWSTFGQVVILGLIQLGGLGIMGAASLLGLLVSRKMGLRTRMTTAVESGQLGIGDVRRVLLGVFKVSLVCEAVVATALGLRFWLAYDASPGRAAWLGLFHGVSSFNNAGFALWSDSLTRFATDPWVCVPVILAVLLGGLGFPVLFELRKELFRPVGWSLHTKMTITTTTLLLAVTVVALTAVEWRNPATLGAIEGPGRVLAGVFQSVMPRSAGFNTVDTAALEDSTLLLNTALMYVGGGSASTAGGIKVTTFLVLLFVILAEVRGDSEVSVFRRRIGHRTQRQALTLALLVLLGIALSSFVLTLLADGAPLSHVVFDATSAITTTGLSTGVAADLPGAGQVLLVALMFLGRLGPITFVSALALRSRPHLYTHPEGRPIIG